MGLGPLRISEAGMFLISRIRSLQQVATTFTGRTIKKARSISHHRYQPKSLRRRQRGRISQEKE